MVSLAILGHKTRGKEVIEILEMLGGINSAHFNGDGTAISYYIELDNSICIIDNNVNYNTVFHKITLEEFLEKFPYKVGDKVSSKYLKNYKIEKMEWDATNNKVIYKLQGMGWYNTNELQPFEDDWRKAVFEANEHACNISLNITKEGNMGNGITYDEIDFNRCPAADKVHLILGDNYEIKEENGNYYVVRKKSKYPKTYEECCDVLIPDCVEFNVILNGYNGELLEKLGQLLICRDAYWKIAGKEMGLDKSWEPNWTTFEGMPAIFRFRYNIVCDSIKNQHCLLVFPTEEMRDAFYENFKDLIEQCKELL